jgi:hypothetical protein
MSHICSHPFSAIPFSRMSIEESLAADYFLKNWVWFGLEAAKADSDTDTEMLQESISPC